MAKSSINFKPVKPNSQKHNEREVELDYNFPDLTKNNETWKSDEIETRQKMIRQKCKEISGRKMQKNAMPVREAVVNLNSSHSMENLKSLVGDLEEKKGVKCFQIHIHRDEGKSKDEINYHAHLLFDWQDEKTGKTVKLNKRDFSEIQTLAAEVLKMERGELRTNSNREHLEPVEYKRQQEEKRVKALQKKVEILNKKKRELPKEIKLLKANTSDLSNDLRRWRRKVSSWIGRLSYRKLVPLAEQLNYNKQSWIDNHTKLTGREKIIEKLSGSLTKLTKLKEEFQQLKEKQNTISEKLNFLRKEYQQKIRTRNKGKDRGLSM